MALEHTIAASGNMVSDQISGATNTQSLVRDEFTYTVGYDVGKAFAEDFIVDHIGEKGGTMRVRDLRLLSTNILG